MRLPARCAAGLLLVSLSACGGQRAPDAANAPAMGQGTAPAGTVGGPGIDCNKASKAVDRAICADPVLVALDADMAAAWQAALARTDDRDALLADQRAWLAGRADCIGMDNERGCLRGQYAIRNAMLGAVNAGPFQWSGHWQRITGGASIDLVPEVGGKVYAVTLAAASGAHGGIEEGGRATRVDERQLRVAPPGNASQDCTLQLRRVANQIEVAATHPEADCGDPPGVDVAGRYMRDADLPPDPVWNLVTLDLADTPQADARIRALLGTTGYAGLVERCDLMTRDETTPGLATCNVRGLFTFMEAALQQQGEAVRVAQIVDDEVRWWSSDPATASTPPPWFDTWREYFADKPVRLMSVPGTPLRDAQANGG